MKKSEKDAGGESRESSSIVMRGVLPQLGAGNIFVVKSGEFLRQNLASRIKSMEEDYDKIKFHEEKGIESSFRPNSEPYSSSKEYVLYGEILQKWLLREGIGGFAEFRSKLNRLRTLFDHFQEGMNYELTVDEVVEILS